MLTILWYMSNSNIFSSFQNVKLSSSIEELTDRLGTKVLVSDRVSGNWTWTSEVPETGAYTFCLFSRK